MMNGEEVQTSFDGYPVTFVPGPKDTHGKFPPPSESEKEALALDLCARTNPSVPDVSIPAFIGELKDLPGMFRELPYLLRGWGRNVLTYLAKANLSWRFGWAPLIGDIRKMLRFQESVNQRLAWLRHLRDEKELRRGFRLPNSNPPEELLGRYAIQSNGGYVMADRYVSYSKNEWATACWKLHPGCKLPWDDGVEGPNSSIYWKAIRLTYGITCYEALAAAWELLPWSWLVDWFVPVGKFIAANNNSLPIVATDLCWMRTLISQTRYVLCDPPLTSEWIAVHGVQDEREVRKQRYVLSPPGLTSLWPRLPALTSGQWSILGSLMYLRSGGKIPHFPRR
jgi:hypothetical protein